MHIKDAATQAKITAVIGILLSEVQSVAAIVPLANVSASPGMMTMAAEQVKKQAPLTASEFVDLYNATMTAKTGNAELDRATAGMRIHLHGEFARWAERGALEVRRKASVRVRDELCGLRETAGPSLRFSFPAGMRSSGRDDKKILRG